MKILSKDINLAIMSYNKINNEKFSVKTAYRFAKLFKKLSEEKEILDDLIKNIFNEYGKKDENGELIQNENGSISFDSDEKRIDCMNKLNDLAETEIEIEDFYFSLEEIGDIKASIDDLVGLIPFIKED